MRVGFDSKVSIVRVRSFPGWCFAVGLCLAQYAGFASGEELPKQLNRILQAHQVPEDRVGVWVQAVGDEQPLLQLGADRNLNPASTIKLVTTWIALDLLGPAYTWRTEVFADQPIVDGVLDGDLYLKGYGDPYLTTEAFWKMLSRLRRFGLREITGDLAFDDSLFAVPQLNPGAFDGQPYRSYNVLPNALLINFKAVRFEFFSDGGSVRVATDPELANLKIRNRLRLVDGPCRGYQAGISFSIPDRQTGQRIELSGTFPKTCAPYGFSRSVLRHHTYAYGLFEVLWSQLGGRFNGRVRKDLAPERDPLLSWSSEPLAQVIRSINKYSNNVMTRQLIYTLALEKMGAPATPENGRQVIVEHLEALGEDATGLVIDNGAGLSRETRISPRLMAAVLRRAYASPQMPEFIASMSLPGLDGTTRRRFVGRPQAGRMHIKTGRIDHVAAIAGFVKAKSNTHYVVVALLNHTDVHRGPGKEFQDALLTWVHSQ